MVVMSLQDSAHSKLLGEVAPFIPDVSFVCSTAFYWSPQRQIIGYSPQSLETPEGVWSLIHEVAHANLQHQTYENDFELLRLEVAAWQRAKEIAQSVGITLDEDHVQDCLDTYRDWLHKRSTCPTCGNVGLQHTSSTYQCHNCHSAWTVTTARFCRPYRKKKTTTIEKSLSPPTDQATFH